ncbi:hypothetical protein ACFL2E_13085, partial [Thermodesulfobacteriota bacterium]
MTADPRRKENTRPFIVPVFIPHAGCPHTCSFCDQMLIANRPDSMPSEKKIAADIARYLSYWRPYHQAPQISFYGGTFLGIGEKRIRNLLE